MKKIISLIALLPLLAAVFSCQRKIDGGLSKNDVSLLELKLDGQMGTAIIERDSDNAKATVYIMAEDNFDYTAVGVKGIVVSYGATASVNKGMTLNFSNPERKARITVTSGSGKTLDWSIYLKPYDAFYIGTWRILEVKLCCNQKLANCGDGQWETQLSGSEFGNFGKPEYDNRIIISMNPGAGDNNTLSGKITNTAGADGAYGHFWGVMSPYSVEAPLDMDPRLRYLLPEGESDWELDLTTNRMKIIHNNVISTMSFAESGDNFRFRFILPSAAGEPSQNGFYDNMWRSSYELYYEVFKMN